MLNKHAVWCQCATVFHATLALACLSSLQTLTLDIDILWSVYLCLSTFVLFAEAEHGTVLGLLPERWQQAGVVRSNFVTAVLIVWTTPQPSLMIALAMTLFLTILGTVLRTKSVLFKGFCMVYFWSLHSWYIAIVSVLYVAAEYFKIESFAQTLDTSTADNPIKYAYAYKTVGICCEAVLLWSVRCLHRFPHLFRWHPVFMSAITMTIAILYCTVYVAETRVSYNAIIKTHGHEMAASMTAATQCSTCRSCLTALDMESSFSDGF